MPTSDRMQISQRPLVPEGLSRTVEERVGLRTASSSSGERAAAVGARERLRQRRLPNVVLQDDLGRSVRFYDDVMKDRRVVLNVMYTVCTNICTPATRNLIEARELLGPMARDVHFVSMTLTPLTDTPDALREYRKRNGIEDERWRFLTGRPEQIERVQRALGFLTDRPEDTLLSHAAQAIICDERNLRWSHANTLTSGRAIARMIRFELV